MDYAIFKMSSQQINHAAIPKALNYDVEIVRQPGSRRCVFYFAETEEIRDLLYRYDLGEPLPIPLKLLFNARNQLFFDSQRVLRGEAI